MQTWKTTLLGLAALAVLALTGCSGGDAVDFDEIAPPATEEATEELYGSYNFLLEMNAPGAPPIAAHFRAATIAPATGVVLLRRGGGDLPKLSAWQASGTPRDGRITCLDQDLNSVVSRTKLDDAFVDLLEPRPNGGIEELRLLVGSIHPLD
jgi:hypothetical protein